MWRKGYKRRIIGGGVRGGVCMRGFKEEATDDRV